MTAHKMLDEKFYSKSLGEELDLIICLPPDFSPLYKYPLFIVQDGKDYFQFGKLARHSEELALNEQIQKPFSLVSHTKLLWIVAKISSGR